MLQSFSDLDFDLSKSLKVISESVIGLSIYDSLLVSNSNIWSNSAPLQDISLLNLSDLDFDFQCHSRPNVIVSLDSPYMVFYLCLIITSALLGDMSPKSEIPWQ